MSNEVIPLRQGYRYSSRPLYSVTPIERASGHEDLNLNWSRPLHLYTVSIDGEMESNIAEVLRFMHAHHGWAEPFRFKDWADYKSCDFDLEATPVDQPAIELTTTTFQLVKDYIYGTQSQRREIRRPLSSAVQVAVDAVPVTSGFSIDEQTGVVTFDSAPGGTVTWGGEFYVPVRFDGDFPIDVSDFAVEGLTFNLRERRV